jgi:hypothetical protein
MQQTQFPPAPDVGLFTRFVLENPWPLAVVLLAIAAAVAWIGLRDGRRRPLSISAVFAFLAAAVLATGLLVTTPAEHGTRVTRELVEAAVAGDVQGAMALFADDAAMTISSPRNPGFSVAALESRLSRLHTQYGIRSNRIRTLRGYTEDRETAIVHLACSTDLDGASAVPTQWVLRIELQEDDSWLITRMTFVSLFGNPPQPNWW